MNKVISRREILQLIGLAGGSAVVTHASAALGLIPAGSLSVPDMASLPPGEQRKVVILGGGISGLVVAYELHKAGYQCVVLEAASRAGGRNLTIRGGDVIDEVGNRQVCEFDAEPHLYFNAGPARIPGLHKNLMHYCRELGVELEIFINENKEAYVQDDRMFDGKPIKNAMITTNARGFMAEIMAKHFSAAELDSPLTQGEAESLLSMVRSFGDLDRKFQYHGSGRAGYESGGFLSPGVHKEMLMFKELLKSRFAGSLLSANEGEIGSILFQPVGGMDKIITGFAAQLPGVIQYNAIVTEVALHDQGVTVSYEHKGESIVLEADYCFNCIPTHLMAGIRHNFPADYVEAMHYVRRGEAYKAAFQAKQRFWENDNIYGGISWTNQPIQQIWYPPHGIHKSKGVILAAYDFGGGMYFTRMSQAERIAEAIKQGEKVHPGYGGMVEKGITIAWHRINHMLGCSARWQREAGGMSEYENQLMQRLREPAAGRHWIIGDQVTLRPGWQESAIISAHWALEDMLKREAA
jgi:monoamine oxidase